MLQQIVCLLSLRDCSVFQKDTNRKSASLTQNPSKRIVSSVVILRYKHKQKHVKWESILRGGSPIMSLGIWGCCSGSSRIGSKRKNLGLVNFLHKPRHVLETLCEVMSIRCSKALDVNMIRRILVSNLLSREFPLLMLKRMLYLIFPRIKRRKITEARIKKKRKVEIKINISITQIKVKTEVKIIKIRVKIKIYLKRKNKWVSNCRIKINPKMYVNRRGMPLRHNGRSKVLPVSDCFLMWLFHELLYHHQLNIELSFQIHHLLNFFGKIFVQMYYSMFFTEILWK